MTRWCWVCAGVIFASVGGCTPAGPAASSEDSTDPGPVLPTIDSEPSPDPGSDVDEDETTTGTPDPNRRPNSAPDTSSDDDGSTTAGSDGTDGASESVSGTSADVDTSDETEAECPNETQSAGEPDPLAIWDDEFDGPSSLGSWTLRSDAEGTAPDHSMLDVGVTMSGHLTVRPTAGGWFNDYVGFLLWTEIEGDFLVETSLSAGRVSNASLPPTQPFNSAGLMVRAIADVPETQNWLTHNLGRQIDDLATEAKSTVESFSTLHLMPGAMSGLLRICRIGSSFLLTRRLADELEFIEMHTFERLDFAEVVQVGLMANGWNATGAEPNTSVTPDIEARFDYVRFRTIESMEDCFAALAP